MTATACVRCAASKCRIEWHHPSGRTRGRPILAFCVPLCVPCHVAEHKIWQRRGLASAKPDQATVVRRIALFHALQHLDALAEVLANLADDLAASATGIAA